ncbi:MAG: hypothetical protein R3E68_13095 [Burkholderiaceae bacterium]
MGKRTTPKKFGGPDALAIEAIFTATVRTTLSVHRGVGQPKADKDPLQDRI